MSVLVLVLLVVLVDERSLSISFSSIRKCAMGIEEGDEQRIKSSASVSVSSRKLMSSCWSTLATLPMSLSIVAAAQGRGRCWHNLSSSISPGPNLPVDGDNRDGSHGSAPITPGTRAGAARAMPAKAFIRPLARSSCSAQDLDEKVVDDIHKLSPNRLGSCWLVPSSAVMVATLFAPL